MLYSEPRYTKDLDIVIGTNPEDIEAVRTALEDFGFPMSDEAAEQLAMPNRMISLGRPPFRIDILNQIEGIDFPEAWGRRNVVDVEGVQASFISREDLVASKRAAGRKQDILDLERLGA